MLRIPANVTAFADIVVLSGPCGILWTLLGCPDFAGHGGFCVLLPTPDTVLIIVGSSDFAVLRIVLGFCGFSWHSHGFLRTVRGSCGSYGVCGCVPTLWNLRGAPVHGFLKFLGRLVPRVLSAGPDAVFDDPPRALCVAGWEMMGAWTANWCLTIPNGPFTDLACGLLHGFRIVLQIVSLFGDSCGIHSCISTVCCAIVSPNNMKCVASVMLETNSPVRRRWHYRHTNAPFEHQKCTPGHSGQTGPDGKS